MRVGFGLLGVLLVGCSADDDEVEHSVRDEGMLCVNGESWPPRQCAPLAFEAGERLTFLVDFQVCYSGTCGRKGEASCSVAVTGNRVVVSASGSYYTFSRGDCTADCRGVTTQCQSEVLPSGDYVIEYGEETLPLTLPSSQARTCLAAGESSLGFGDYSCCDSDQDCLSGICTAHRCEAP